MRNLEARATYPESLILAGHCIGRDQETSMGLSIVLVIVNACQSHSGCPVSQERSTVRVRSRVVEEEIAYGRLLLSRRRHFTVLLLCYPKANGTVFHLDCIIIKRHKGRSEVKRLLTIAEDSRLIAYITREVTLYIYVYLFLSLIVAEFLPLIYNHASIFFTKSNFPYKTS